MNLKILFTLLGYYAMIIILLTTTGTPFCDIDYNASINGSELSEDETDTGGLFSVGVSVARFFALVGFGVGLPSSVPSVIATTFMIWQSLITMFTVGFIISSIWDG